MNYKNVLRCQPWLSLTNVSRISERLLRLTKGNVFIAYNRIQGRYELHAVKSFQLTGYSYNATVEKEFLNGFIVHDFQANNHERFAEELEDRRAKINRLYDKREETRFDTEELLKTVSRTLGVKL